MQGTIPPKSGMVRTTSNRTPLYRSAGKLSFDCPVCGISFEKPAAWAKRVSNHYCSVACTNEAKKVRIETHCVVCGKAMEQTPSDAARVTTCGKKCSSIRRRSKNPKPKAFLAYKEVIKQIAQRGVCVLCGAKHGPWVVRGLNGEIGADNELSVTATDAELWCKHCHLKDISPLGIAALLESIK